MGRFATCHVIGNREEVRSTMHQLWQVHPPVCRGLSPIDPASTGFALPGLPSFIKQDGAEVYSSTEANGACPMAVESASARWEQFSELLSQRVDQYFTSHAVQRNADTYMIAKIVFGFSYFVVTYLALAVSP